MEWLGKCLSCFVTERKHRQVKDASLYVFRYMEHTVLADVVNKHCQQITSGHDLFSRRLLVEPRECALQPDYLTSARAVLECGPIEKGDVIFFKDKTCGVVQAFFIISNVYFVEYHPMPAVNDELSLRDKTQSESCFKECRLVVDSCIRHPTDQAGIEHRISNYSIPILPPKTSPQFDSSPNSSSPPPHSYLILRGVLVYAQRRLVAWW